MSSNSDRNLLVGILALQMDFISREQLIAATHVWVTGKARPLDEILLEQDALRGDTHPLLVALVDKHLEMHEGDAERSLAAVSSIGSLRDELNKLGDGEIEATMSLVAVERDTLDPDSTESFTAGGSGSGGNRFRVLRPHAKGGLGEVFVARDVELNREVALKEIQPQHADNTDSRSRFVLEAEVTGGLEHPGIVPVYGLGQYGDGRPYYAMRFIRGDSLKEAIDRFHGTDKSAVAGGVQVSYDSVEFRKLLGRFVDVCNAIQYAHSRGVLHRDLKPGNIMLGRYGETLVVDWGLAKLQGRDDETRTEGEATLQPSSGSGSAPTQFGSAIGTPAYMPPEQAAGKLDELGPESDVYSLGATLCHLLTGQSPVAGKSLGELLKKVQQGDFNAPRQVNPNVPKPLDAICLRAMATRPQDRYASPQELGDDVERYLADEPVTAHSDPLVDRARRWVRKHQTVAVTTAALALLLLVGLGVFSSIIGGKNSQLANLIAKLDTKNVELTQANQREADARLLAEANEQAARQQSELALATLTSVTLDLQDGLRNLPGGGVIRRRVLKTALVKLKNVSTKYVEQSKVDRQTIWALFEMGDVVLKFGVEDIGDSESSATADELSQERESTVELAGTFYRRAQQVAEQLAADDPSNAQAQRDLSVSYIKIGDVQSRSGQTSEALASYQKSLEVAEPLSADDPSNVRAQYDLSNSYSKIGDVQSRSGQTSEALASYQKSLEIFEQLAADDPSNAQAQHNLSSSYSRIGDVQLQSGQSSEALASYQRSLEIREQLAADDPSNVEIQRDLSVSYSKIGDMQLRSGHSSEALASYQKSLEIFEQLAADDPSNAQAQHNLSNSYSMIGNMQLQSGQSSEALASYQRCLEIRQQLAADDPSNAVAQRSLSISYEKIGDVQLQSGQSSEALASYQKSLEICEQLAAENPSNAQAQRDVSVSYSMIGNMQLQSGQSSEALAFYQRSLEIDEQLAADDPSNALAQRSLSISYEKIGDVQLQSGQSSEALASYQKSLEIFEQLAADDPSNAQAQRRPAVSYEKIGDVQLHSGQSSEALASYQKSLEIFEQLAADDPSNAQAQRSLSISYDKVGDAQLQSGLSSEALASCQKCLEIRERLAADDPASALAQRDLMAVHYSLGLVNQSLRDYETAAAEFESAAAVLRRMINQGMSIEASKRDLASMERVAASATQAKTALGDWAALLEQPAESLPSLLDLRGIEFAKRSRFTEAAQAAAKMRELDNADSGQLYNAACVFCLCAASIKTGDGEELSAKQKQQREQYIADALAALKQAITAGWDDFAHMQKDSDLAILRDLPEFRELLPQANPADSDQSHDGAADKPEKQPAEAKNRGDG